MIDIPLEKTGFKIDMKQFFNKPTKLKPHTLYIPKPIKKINNIGRNERCPCQSGMKYKFCCWAKINNRKPIIKKEE